MKTASAVALFLIALPNQGAAQDTAPPPLSTDRPNFTGSVTTLARGQVQVEAGYTFTDDVGVNLHTFGEVWLRVGLADYVELLVVSTRSRGLTARTQRTDSKTRPSASRWSCPCVW